MNIPATKVALLAAAAIAFGGAPAVAQTTSDGTGVSSQAANNDNVETTTRTVRTEDNDFPWGLLGLLGLAGLIPRKRKEADIHVDARRDTADR